MKSERGITLISLTIYVIVMAIVIGVVSLISTYFFKNTQSAIKDIEPLTEATRFTSFFTEEVNHDNIKILACDTVGNGEQYTSYIVFDNGVQYTFISENKGIYRNQVKICRWVENCTFEHTIKNGKDVVTVTIKMEKGQEKKIDYTLKN